MTSAYFQHLEELQKQIDKQNVTSEQLASTFLYLVSSAKNLDVESQNEAVVKISELVEFASVKGSPELGAMLGIIGGAIIELKKANPILLLPQVYTLMMNMLHHAKPILEIYANNPNPDKRELKQSNPQSFYAWEVLDKAWLPLTTIFTHSQQAREKIRKDKKFLEFLEPYVSHHEGCMWIYRALHIYDGEIMVFHPEQMLGYRIMVEDIDHPFTLSNLLTEKLVGDPTQGCIPKKPKSSDIAQFWIYNWEVLKEMPEDFKDLSVMKYLKSPAYMGSESWMFDLSFYNGIPVLVLIDTDFKFGFNIPGSFPELSSKITILETLDRTSVQDWLSKLRNTE
ncbi:MAG: hypothetical protein GF411_19295 [Candidatus Lokiarchaeota archaeon]|nr:hypothetical protein [Candidatus Lokiarchaeota archaeon]